MKPWFKVVLSVITLLACSLAGFIGYTIYKNIVARKNVLGAMKVEVLDKNNLVFPTGGDLKYYFEPKPDSVVTESPNWLSYTVTHTFNDDSFNARQNYTVEKPAGVYRIMALGDSFTLGAFVNTTEAWPQRLEDLLNSASCTSNKKFEVINLGMSGYDVQYIVHRFEARGIKYTPDLIIWLESGYGFDRMNELLTPIVNYSRSQLTPEDYKKYQKEGIYYPEYQLAYKLLYQKYSDAQIAKYLQTFWNDFFRARGTTPVVIATFPTISDQYKIRLQELTKGQQNLLTYDGLPDINSLNGVFPDTHPNVRGHQLIAEDLFRYLNEHSFVQCR